MFRLHVVQAASGDGLVLSFGAPGKLRHILIDGGPPGSYAADLEPALGEIIGPGGQLELVILSQVDNRHMVGVLDLLAAVEDDKVSGRKPRAAVAGLWYNSFKRTIDQTGDLSQQMQAVMMLAGAASNTMTFAGNVLHGMEEGPRLRLMAKKLGIPLNKGFEDDLIIVETSKTPIKLGPLELRIAGPSMVHLQALQKEWLDWLEKTARHAMSDPATAETADKGVPNLGSIVILAKCDGKTILLTGDARGDHIVDGLKTAGLTKGGKLHVDVLKVQRRGSDRNAKRDFFDAITADTYIISANGEYGSPDFDTLRWIVESAHDRQRPITLVSTNETDTIKQLQTKLKSSDYGYSLTVLPQGRHSVEITLSA
jgi:hypothetical protein